MKILPSGQIQIEPGDTLYNIYGPNWRQLSGYTGDPTKLQVGTILPAPPNLKSTMTTTATLPQAQQSELAKLKQQLEEATGKLEKARVWLSSYPGATPTSQIPDWVLNAQSPEVVKSLITPKRIEELETIAFQMPQKSFQDIWNENYQASKLPELEQKIADIKSKLYAAEGQINENPWLSEASRVGRVKRLYELAQKDISNLTDQYNAELNKIKMLVDAAYKEAQTKRALQQQELNYLVKKNVPEALWPENSPETYREWVLAGGEKGTGKSYVEYVKERAAKQVTTPSSYREWQLAGGQEGTGKTYAEWLKPDRPTKEILTQNQLNRLGLEGISSIEAIDIQTALNAGYTIDQIKKGIKQSGGNPAIVDTFIKVMKSTPTFTFVQP